jgi:hypothetical protein
MQAGRTIAGKILFQARLDGGPGVGLVGVIKERRTTEGTEYTEWN